MKEPVEKQAFQIGDRVQCYVTGVVERVELDLWSKGLTYTVKFHKPAGLGPAAVLKEVGHGTFQAGALENVRIVPKEEAVTE